MNNLTLFSRKPLTGAVFSACLVCGGVAYSSVAVAEGTSSYDKSQTSTQAAPDTQSQSGSASATSGDQQRSASNQQDQQRSNLNQQEQRSAASDPQDQQRSNLNQQEQRSAASDQQEQQGSTAMSQQEGNASENASDAEEAPAAIVSVVAITEVPVVDVEQLIDTDVINQEGETIGDVEQVVTNPDGTIAGLIVGAGGVLGIGETDLFAPATELQVTPDGVLWQTRLDEDTLAEMPQYQAEEYSIAEQ